VGTPPEGSGRRGIPIATAAPTAATTRISATQTILRLIPIS
jgi:hypothetical protein